MAASRKKIIAVDDNAENLTAIKHTLKNAYEVYPIPSAFKMFNLLEHIQPDLILLDVEMPDMDGYEAAKKLKSLDKFREIPIIFLTSRDDPKSEIEGLNLGAVDYIHKPFVSQLLLTRIQAHLSYIDHQFKSLTSSRSKNEFLSHIQKIRPPLDSVMDMINAALNTDDIQKIKQCLKNAGEDSRRLLSIINNILDIQTEANKTEEAEQYAKCGFNFNKYTLLIAEDVDINKEILSAILGKTGISIDFAENGASAVSMFRANPDKYNLILMDVNMPEMDGYEATKAIRALPLTQAKDICIIAMTANVFQEDIEKCLSAGMNGHIGKPVSMEALCEILQKKLKDASKN